MNDEVDDLRQDGGAGADATDDAAVYAFLRRTRGDLIGRLDQVLPIEAAIANTVAPKNLNSEHSAQPAASNNEDAWPSRVYVVLPQSKQKLTWRAEILWRIISAAKSILANILSVISWYHDKIAPSTRAKSWSTAASIPHILDTLIRLSELRTNVSHTPARGKSAVQATRVLTELRDGLDQRRLTQEEARQLVKMASVHLGKALKPPMAERLTVGSWDVMLIPAGVAILTVASWGTSVIILTVLLAWILISTLLENPGKKRKTWSIASALLQSLDQKIVRLFDNSDDNSDTILQS